MWSLITLTFDLFAPFPPAQEVISAEPGQTVTLPCKANGSEPVTAVEWTRLNPETEDVLFYRRGKGEDPASQNPSYKNRASLKDEQMKDGDVSLVLKNVKPNDTGTYQCQGHILLKKDVKLRVRGTGTPSLCFLVSEKKLLLSVQLILSSVVSQSIRWRWNQGWSLSCCPAEPERVWMETLEWSGGTDLTGRSMCIRTVLISLKINTGSTEPEPRWMQTC
uniref:Ig-like domain-containing protein n=1 Tax=Poecilia mexicana TaxID=48701 RepID=A0A3B3Y549_9TELE